MPNVTQAQNTKWIQSCTGNLMQCISAHQNHTSKHQEASQSTNSRFQYHSATVTASFSDGRRSSVYQQQLLVASWDMTILLEKRLLHLLTFLQSCQTWISTCEAASEYLAEYFPTGDDLYPDSYADRLLSIT